MLQPLNFDNPVPPDAASKSVWRTYYQTTWWRISMAAAGWACVAPDLILCLMYRVVMPSVGLVNCQSVWASRRIRGCRPCTGVGGPSASGLPALPDKTGFFTHRHRLCCLIFLWPTGGRAMIVPFPAPWRVRLDLVRRRRLDLVVAPTTEGPAHPDAHPDVLILTRAGLGLYSARGTRAFRVGLRHDQSAALFVKNGCRCARTNITTAGISVELPIWKRGDAIAVIGAGGSQPIEYHLPALGGSSEVGLSEFCNRLPTTPSVRRTVQTALSCNPTPINKRH